MLSSAPPETGDLGPRPASVDETFGDRVGLADAYARVLATRGVEWGLIGPREVPRIWERHLLNSVAPASLLPDGSSVVDVGSGAGLPGIPLAILRPDLRMTLLEPLLRRHTFLEETIAELGLGDVDAVRGRAEDARDTYDVVTCRAVAPLTRLLGWTVHLFRPDGQLVALKGSSAQDEVAGAGAVLRRDRLAAEVLSVRAHPSSEATTVIRVRAAR